MKSKLALITTWYPPKSGVAVNRMRAFATYLSEKYEVHVFCDGEKDSIVQESDSCIVHYQQNKTILDWVKSSRTDHSLVHKAKTAIRIVLNKVIKDPMKSWVQKTIKSVRKEQELAGFDFLISSFSPKEPHEVALQILKENPTIVWVADMRDEMMNNQNISQAESDKLGQLEREIGEYCSAFTSVSLPIVEVFEKHYPKVPAFEIRNGFDFDTTKLKDFNQDDTIRIGYFGTFYGNRKPTNFFKALVPFLEENSTLKLELHFVGTHRNFEVPKGLTTRVFYHDPMIYHDAVQFMATMTANLMVEPITENKGIFTGKIFDYLAVKRPVLAMTDKTDVAAELIVELNAGYVASFNDIDEQRKVLKEFLNDFLERKLRMASDEDIAKLHRKEQVKLLIEQLEKLKK